MVMQNSDGQFIFELFCYSTHQLAWTHMDSKVRVFQHESSTPSHMARPQNDRPTLVVAFCDLCGTNLDELILPVVPWRQSAFLRPMSLPWQLEWGMAGLVLFLTPSHTNPSLFLVAGWVNWLFRYTDASYCHGWWLIIFNLTLDLLCKLRHSAPNPLWEDRGVIGLDSWVQAWHHHGSSWFIMVNGHADAYHVELGTSIF